MAARGTQSLRGVGVKLPKGGENMETTKPIIQADPSSKVLLGEYHFNIVCLFQSIVGFETGQAEQ